MKKDAGPRGSTLAIGVMSSFLTPFIGAAANIALPSIGRDFQIDAVLLSLVATAFLLASMVSLVPAGRLADIHGKKKIFLFGYVFSTISSLLCGLSFNPFMLIIFRVSQGVGGAMFFATIIPIMISAFPPEDRGRVLGITAASVYSGLSLGPVVGGFLTDYLTWRGVFFFNVPFGIVIIFLGLWKLKDERAMSENKKFDTIGSIIYALSMVAIVFGLTRLPSPHSLWFILFGVFGIFVFLQWEARVKNPLFELSLFRRNRVFVLSNLAAFSSYSATHAISFLLSIYLQHIKAFSPKRAGLVLLSQFLMQAIFSPFAGRLSDRIEPRIVASIGMAFTTAGLFMLSFIGSDSSLGFIIASLLLVGFGFALFAAPNTNAIMSSVDKTYYGLASGVAATTRQLGMLGSMCVATILFALLIGRVQISVENYPELLKSIKAAFVIFSVLCFGGIFASLIRGKMRPGGTNASEPVVRESNT